MMDLVKRNLVWPIIYINLKIYVCLYMCVCVYTKRAYMCVGTHKFQMCSEILQRADNVPVWGKLNHRILCSHWEDYSVLTLNAKVSAPPEQTWYWVKSRESRNNSSICWSYQAMSRMGVLRSKRDLKELKFIERGLSERQRETKLCHLRRVTRTEGGRLREEKVEEKEKLWFQDTSLKATVIRERDYTCFS